MRRILLSILLLLFCATAACAAIAETGTSMSGDTGADPLDTITVAHDSGSGTPRITVVGVSQRGTGDTDVQTYGGQQLTLLMRQDSTTTTLGCEMWYIVDGPTGSNDVIIEFGTTKRYAVGAVSFTGINAASPWSDSDSAENDGVTSISVTLDTTTGHMAVAVTAKRNTAGTWVPDASLTSQWVDETTNATTDLNVEVGAASKADGGEIEWTSTATAEKTLCAGLLAVELPAEQRRTVIIGPGGGLW